MTVMVSEDGRRCDASCYDARHANCHCICGGTNHGLGLEHALRSADELVDRINTRRALMPEELDDEDFEDEDFEDEDIEDDDVTEEDLTDDEALYY